MEGLSFRYALGTDAFRIIELVKQLEEEYEITPNKAKDAFYASLKDKGHIGIVAELDRDIIGFCDIWIYPDVFHQGVIATLQNLVVDKTFRRRGVGKALVRKAVEQCKKRGVVAVHVSTTKANAPALALYEGLGFGTDYGEAVFLEKNLRE